MAAHCHRGCRSTRRPEPSRARRRPQAPYAVTITATDSAGFSGTSSLHVDGDERRHGGTAHPTDLTLGIADHAPDADQPGLVVDGHHRGMDRREPSRWPVDRQYDRCDLGHSDDGGQLHRRHGDGDGLGRIQRLGPVRLAGRQHRHRVPHRRPVELHQHPGDSGHAVGHGLADLATGQDRLDGHRSAERDQYRPHSGVMSGTPTAAGTYR